MQYLLPNLILISVLISFADSLGSLPDASQEGLLAQFSNYASVTVFHYVVPPEVVRATWEFASFQDDKDCPSREAHIYIQHGSYPVFSADNSSFPDHFYTERSYLSNTTVFSEYQPSNSVVHAVYNPMPGTWFAVSFLSPFVERHGLLKGCRYSMGSIALWSKADNVELVLPHRIQTFRTRRHFSYYKFYIEDAVDAFKLVISNCIVRVKHERPKLSANICLDFVDIRARALPFHNMSSPSSYSNISSEKSVIFFESRPVKPSMYFIIVVSHGEVTFDLSLTLKDCGETGLYGKPQNEWYMNERGLMRSEKYNTSRPKEPQTGFQLLSTKLSSIQTEETKANFVFNTSTPLWTKMENESIHKGCAPTFDFTRVDSVAEFTVNYLLQGRSWYIKWVSINEANHLFTRFDTLDFLDLGGFVNINISMDTRKINHHMYQRVFVCLSKDRRPDVLACPETSRMVVSDSSTSDLSKLLVIPFPEPGKWYLGFRMECIARQSELVEQCPKNLKEAMLFLNLHIQPCDYRPLHDICGSHGMCAKAIKGQFRFSSCTCFAGYKGWTCDDGNEVTLSLARTLLLTLSNLAFLPAVILALYYKLYTEALIYSATMIFSTFYHLCDQEALSTKLPELLEKACLAFYVNREVLQFADFFSATLSFWVTVVALARLPHKLVNFLNMLGVILIAVLVQYNRTGILVFAIPVPLGLLVLLVSFQVRSFRTKKLIFPNKMCIIFFLPAFVCSTVALSMVGFLETNINYYYLHSAWHALIALSLLFLLPLCKEVEEDIYKIQTEESPSISTSSSTTGSSEMVEIRDIHSVVINQNDENESHNHSVSV